MGQSRTQCLSALSQSHERVDADRCSCQSKWLTEPGEPSVPLVLCHCRRKTNVPGLQAMWCRTVRHGARDSEREARGVLFSSLPSFSHHGDTFGSMCRSFSVNQESRSPQHAAGRAIWCGNRARRYWQHNILFHVYESHPYIFKTLALLLAWLWVEDCCHSSPAPPVFSPAEFPCAHSISLASGTRLNHTHTHTLSHTHTCFDLEEVC